MARRHALVEVSHDKRRPRNFAAGDLPEPLDTAPQQDPTTKQFLPGNDLWRRRLQKRVEAEARKLPHLSPDKASEQLAPFVVWALGHMSDLVGGAAMDANEVALAEELTIVRAVLRFEASQFFAGVPKAGERLRFWLRDARQQALAFEGITRLPSGSDGDDDDVSQLRRKQADFQRRLADRQRHANERTDDDPQCETSETDDALDGQQEAEQ